MSEQNDTPSNDESTETVPVDESTKDTAAPADDAPDDAKKSTAKKSAKTDVAAESEKADDSSADVGEKADDDKSVAKKASTRTRTRTRTSTKAKSDDEKADDAAKADADDTADKDGDDDKPAKPKRKRSAAKKSTAKKSTAKKKAKSKKKADDEPKADAADDADAPSDDVNPVDDVEVEASDDGRSQEDRETEKAIAKGGTRLAAKRRGRSGSGAGGGGGGGGGGGRGRGGNGPRGVSEETRRAILDGPPRTMLVTHTEDRTQIAVLEERQAVEHYVTHAGDVTYVGNIYMARVQNVLPGMEAAFLDIGKGRNGVLYAGEVLYDEQDLEDGAPRIEDTLKPGQKVLVQVTKDPMGTKGPRLTQMLSLAGRYCVLAPNSDLFGISRKLTDKERDRLRKIVKKVKPEEHGIIVRTAAENASDEALTADLERLLAKWEKVEAAAKDAKPMTAVYEEPKLVVKVIRDNFGPEFVKCIVDDKTLFEEVTTYLGEVAEELVEKVELYEPHSEGEHDKPESLFGAYNVAEQLRKATEKKVWLPSGGYLIIETTEAMKVVDVNTGKFTGSKDTSLEEVVLKTNLEAADEIVRQLRLRDMGGIIIIDFIDMLLKANQDQVIRRLKRELLRDRTKTRVSEVSRLGLVQMTRKNVSHGLVESFSTKCDACNGLGRVLDLPE